MIHCGCKFKVLLLCFLQHRASTRQVKIIEVLLPLQLVLEFDSKKLAVVAIELFIRNIEKSQHRQLVLWQKTTFYSTMQNYLVVVDQVKNQYFFGASVCKENNQSLQLNVILCPTDVLYYTVSYKLILLSFVELNKIFILIDLFLLSS